VVDLRSRAEQCSRVGRRHRWVGFRLGAAVAVAGLVIVYVLMALVAGPLGRALGFPPYRPDEAYTVTLDRWRNERKLVGLAKLGRKDG
jgi:hypothetical protein